MKIVFRNLDKSELAREAVEERLGDMIEKFPKLNTHKMVVTLGMDNSPTQPGPDSFSVSVLVQGSEYGTFVLTKNASSLYLALAEVREHLLEKLNRTGDRARVRKRHKERKLQFTH